MGTLLCEAVGPGRGGLSSIRLPPSQTGRGLRRRCHAGILGPGVVGGGFLRTGCGPGPLEPAPGNAGEGNTARTDAAAPSTGGAAVFVSMKITVNGREMEVTDGLSVEALLTHLAVKREYTAVAVNREITPKASYASV